MATRTDAQVWPEDHPLVIFMTPADEAEDCAYATKFVVQDALQNLGWGIDDIECFGLIAAGYQHGIEGLFFLGDTGVDPRNITLLMLWGETAEYLEFEEEVSYECGIGFVSLMQYGVVLPVMLLPSLKSGWWADMAHQKLATETFVKMVEHGRIRPGTDERLSYVYSPVMFN